MSTATLAEVTHFELITFRCGGMLFGLDIRQVREINCQLPLTPLPCAAKHLRGLISLRGDVLTVLDLNALAGLPSTTMPQNPRYVILEAAGERFALYVDAVEDVVSCETSDLLPIPENFPVERPAAFVGVYPLPTELLYVLEPVEMFSRELPTA